MLKYLNFGELNASTKVCGSTIEPEKERKREREGGGRGRNVQFDMEVSIVRVNEGAGSRRDEEEVLEDDERDETEGANREDVEASTYGWKETDDEGWEKTAATETPQRAINKFDTESRKVSETSSKWCQYIDRFIAELPLATRGLSLSLFLYTYISVYL